LKTIFKVVFSIMLFAILGVVGCSASPASKALIVIDYINDFVDSNGALTCGSPGQQIDAKLLIHVKEFAKNGDLVIFASDNHEVREYRFNPEQRLFPLHGNSAWGRDVYGATGKYYRENAAQDNVFYIPKMRYSAFFDSDIDLLLREHNIHDIYLVGVCTDICVMQTAIYGYDLMYKINIYEDSVASFNQENHLWALKYMKNILGANIL